MLELRRSAIIIHLARSVGNWAYGFICEGVRVRVINPEFVRRLVATWELLELSWTKEAFEGEMRSRFWITEHLDQAMLLIKSNLISRKGHVWTHEILSFHHTETNLSISNPIIISISLHAMLQSFSNMIKGFHLKQLQRYLSSHTVVRERFLWFFLIRLRKLRRR